MLGFFQSLFSYLYSIVNIPLIPNLLTSMLGLTTLGSGVIVGYTAARLLPLEVGMYGNLGIAFLLGFTLQLQGMRHSYLIPGFSITLLFFGGAMTGILIGAYFGRKINRKKGHLSPEDT